MVSYLKNISQRVSYLKTRHIFESYNIYLKPEHFCHHGYY